MVIFPSCGAHCLQSLSKPNGYISLIVALTTFNPYCGSHRSQMLAWNNWEWWWNSHYTYFIVYSSFGTEEWLYRLYRCHHRSAGSVYEILGYDFRESSESFDHVGWWNHNSAVWNTMNRPALTFVSFPFFFKHNPPCVLFLLVLGQMEDVGMTVGCGWHNKVDMKRGNGFRSMK